ncbi:hypothetical protein HBI56_135840 [Parastagonospora nodorum]|uniref:Uncharacterized protein n=1 Tax=Phaeosphaeria nodorum (strain SN15 / ATCC MYA-4574 / FGSC 10173) TaxID=321614 RepID=A0A7U2I2Z3_PHANO|nr:hypothetical protein HBH56_038930 [Parastagonospora nodorum]QRC99823.1 hypothetical protein JI435_414070 [Parastagonospora nodorum SN15]KAH3933509.1 hypothetical protein HBH54_060530 [Parastagonospora nodorum]KAH3940995.1 hypothetical protein HBH53_207750 [Parastagonospora nodorum]KAH3958020.1 hypothetical protein HBH51_215440 [Parastagonospora nodorum]
MNLDHGSGMTTARGGSPISTTCPLHGTLLFRQLFDGVVRDYFRPRFVPLISYASHLTPYLRSSRVPTAAGDSSCATCFS